MPEITPIELAAIDLAAPQGGTLALIAKTSPTENTDDNTLGALMLVVPVFFLLAIALLLLERATKWDIRRFFR